MILQDNALLSGPLLQGNLAGQNDEFSVSLQDVGIRDLTEIWGGITQQPYKTSVSYLVSTAVIESEQAIEINRVKTKELIYKQIETSGGGTY